MAAHLVLIDVCSVVYGSGIYMVYRIVNYKHSNTARHKITSSRATKNFTRFHTVMQVSSHYICISIVAEIMPEYDAFTIEQLHSAQMVLVRSKDHTLTGLVKGNSSQCIYCLYYYF